MHAGKQTEKEPYLNKFEKNLGRNSAVIKITEVEIKV